MYSMLNVNIIAILMHGKSTLISNCVPSQNDYRYILKISTIDISNILLYGTDTKSDICQ